MVKIALAAVPLIAFACAAEADMFQWTSPESGKVQLSGEPPAWYRAARTGPRVLVFDNGRLVDDTAVSVSDAQRAVLRERAFGAGSEPATAATIEEQTRADLRAAMDEAHELGIDVDEVATEFNEAVAAEEAATDTASLSDRVATLKALIDAWDQQQGQQAREVLQRLPAQ